MSNYTSKYSGAEIDERLDRMESPLPVTGGGTGATSREGALMSFGIEDYVVNEGEITYTTSYQTSINYYRIWNDGFAEVWSRGTRTGVPITSSYGNLYIGSFSWEIPFYFGDTEKVFSHISRCQYDTGASWGQTLDNGSGYINVRIYDNYSRNGDYPIKVSLYASGMFGSWR